MRKIILALFLFLLILFPLHSYSATYYVDGGPLGNNTNSGLSVDVPFKTIQAAINKCSPGSNTIYIRGPHDSFEGVYNISVPIDVKVGGADDNNRMVVRGFSSERPVIDGPVTGAAHGIDLNGDFITLQQLRVQNASGTAIRSTHRNYINIIDVEVYHNNTSWQHDGAIYHFGGSYHLIRDCRIWNNNGHGIKIADGRIHHCVVDNCVIYNNGSYQGMNDPGNLTSHPMGISIADAGGYHTVRNCRIYSNAFKAINIRSIGNTGYNEVYNNVVFDNNHHRDWSYSDQGMYGEIDIMAGHHTKIFRNTIYSGVQYGINVGDSYCEIHNNVIYNNGSHQIAIQLNTGGTIIYNNTVYGSSENAVIQTWSGSAGTIKNNIIHRVGPGYCWSKYGTWTWDYNLWYAPNGSVGVTLSANDKGVNPGFTSPEAGNFHRTASSSFIDLAVDLGPPYDIDRDGYLRRGPWDFGAYVFDAAPKPPGNLRILQ